MAVYDLSGVGVQGLTPGTTRVFVEVLTLPAGTSTGQAIPENYYNVGLLRVGVSGAYGPVVPIDALDMFLDLPEGTSTIGFHVFNSGAIRLSEATPVIPPGDTISQYALSDVSFGLFTDTEGISLGNSFIPTTTGLQLVGVRLYRPPSDTSVETVTFAIYEPPDADPLHAQVDAPYTSGWNTYSFTPIALSDTAAIVLAYQSFAGRTRCAESGGWSTSAHAEVGSYACRFTVSDTLVSPGSDCGGAFLGMDYLIQLP